MAFYRHFIERKDFEISVVTNCGNFPADRVPYQPVLFTNARVTRRLFRSRLLPWLYGPHLLTTFGRVPRTVWQEAEKFKPDAVFTIAGSWDWSALVAQAVARRLDVPVVASFNDWFNYGWFPSHPVYHGMIERRFRRFYHEVDLALCTCEGMREALGSHPNAHILYPMGAAISYSDKPLEFDINGRPRFVVGFAGSMADWYGPMLERLVMASETQKAPLEFRFYGSNPTWSKEFDAHARRTGIFRGHRPFNELQTMMRETDALILPMGFEERAALVEQTSFKTKFLDYLSFQKPILVWGPDYCSAVRVAREFDSAEICTKPDANEFVQKTLRLAESPGRQAALVSNAKKMYEDRFYPDKIHAGLVQAIRETIEKNRKLN